MVRPRLNATTKIYDQRGRWFVAKNLTGLGVVPSLSLLLSMIGAAHAGTFSGWTVAPVPYWPDWSAVASSSDGTRLVATESHVHVHTSADSGYTWTGTSLRSGGLSAVASSSDGTKLVAVTQPGQIYLTHYRASAEDQVPPTPAKALTKSLVGTV